MKATLDELSELDLRELSQTLAAHAPAVAELGPGEWLSAVELLTMRLTDEGPDIPADSWATCAAALTYTLTAAVTSGSVDHRETVIRRLNLSAALLQRIPPHAEVDVLDPRRVAEIFLHEVPMTADEARRLAADWRSLDISDIRRLRACKSLAFPAILALRAAFGEDFDARVKVWEDVIPSLP